MDYAYSTSQTNHQCCMTTVYRTFDNRYVYVVPPYCNLASSQLGLSAALSLDPALGSTMGPELPTLCCMLVWVRDVQVHVACVGAPLLYQ